MLVMIAFSSVGVLSLFAPVQSLILTNLPSFVGRSQITHIQLRPTKGRSLMDNANRLVIGRPYSTYGHLPLATS